MRPHCPERERGKRLRGHAVGRRQKSVGVGSLFRGLRGGGTCSRRRDGGEVCVGKAKEGGGDSQPIQEREVARRDEHELEEDL